MFETPSPQFYRSEHRQTSERAYVNKKRQSCVNLLFNFIIHMSSGLESREYDRRDPSR
jgi:hypothetical protein